MAINSQFKPEYLRSYSALQNYLVGPSTDQCVEQKVLQASTVNWKKWHWIEWLAEPFAPIYALFLRGLGSLIYYAGFSRKGLQLDLESDVYEHSHLRSGFRLFGDDYLAHSINSYSPEAIDLYQQQPIPVQNLTSPKIQQAIDPQRTLLDFDVKNGCCNGNVLWMLRAYLKTKKFFTNSRRHFQALGSLFTRGAPTEAALIHKLCPQNTFLKLRVTQEGILFSGKNKSAQKCCSAIFRALKNLDEGAYRIGVGKHALAYISPNKKENYFFDPNLGTAAISNQKRLLTLTAIIYEYYSSEKKPKNGRLKNLLFFLHKFELDET